METTKHNSMSISLSIVTQLTDPKDRIGNYIPHTQFLKPYIRRWRPSEVQEKNSDNIRSQEVSLINLQVIVCKDCISCALVTPILRYAEIKGYINHTEVIKFANKQHYLRATTKIARRHNQKNSYPLILIHHAGRETMVSADIVNNLLDEINQELDPQTFLDILRDSVQVNGIEELLAPIVSRFILGVFQTINSTKIS